MVSPRLVVEGLDFRYPGTEVFRGLHLDVSLEGLTQVVGPNGGGKSTLAKLAVGLLSPTQGRVGFGAEPRPRVGYVPQALLFDRSFPILTREVVLMGCLDRPWGFPTKDQRRAATEVLESLDLGALARRPFSSLSGGQRQRVLIARALVDDPEVLMLDEPTANVDHTSAAQIGAILADLKATRAVVLITHDFDFLADAVDRVLCVNRAVHVHPSGPLPPEALRRLFSHHFQDLSQEVVG